MSDPRYAELKSICEVPMVCTTCGSTFPLGECEPCIAPDGSEGTGFGCPVEDCGGYMVEFGR